MAMSLNNLAILYETWANTRRRSRSTSAASRSAKPSWDRTIPTWPEPQQPGDPVLGHRPIRESGAAVPAQPQDPRSEAGIGPPRRGQSLNNLAILYHGHGPIRESGAALPAQPQDPRSEAGPDHPDVAASLNNLANLYRDMGQYAKAEPLYQRSLKICEAKLGPDHPDVAISLNNLANCTAMGAIRESGAALPAKPQDLRSRLGPDHPDVATSLNNLAALYEAMAQFAKAESLYQRSLKIRKQSWDRTTDVASSLHNLAFSITARAGIPRPSRWLTVRSHCSTALVQIPHRGFGATGCVHRSHGACNERPRPSTP